MEEINEIKKGNFDKPRMFYRVTIIILLLLLFYFTFFGKKKNENKTESKPETMPDNSPLSGASVVPSFSEDFKSTNADFIIYDVWYNDKIHVTEPEYEFIKRAFGGYVLTEPLAKLRDGFLVEDMKALANEYISGKNALYYGLRYDNPEKTQSSLGRKYEQNVSSNYSNGAIYVNVSNIAFSTALVSSTNQTVKGAEIDGYYLVSFFFVQTYRNPHAIGINRSVVFRDKAKGLAFYQKVKELLDYKIV